MNVFTYFDRTSARFFVMIAMFAITFSAIFAPFTSVQAASTGITLNKSSLVIDAGVRGNFVVSATNDADTFSEDTYIGVSDGSGGGNFHNGTTGGDCNAAAVDPDNKFDIDQNKGVCYSNTTPGDYTITVQLYDGADAPIGASQQISVTVNAVVDPNDTKKVQYCHATDSATNPFTFLDTSVNALLNAGHDEHENDIIPAFNEFPAKNLTTVYPAYDGKTGQQILDAGCPGVPTDETDTEIYGCTNVLASNYNPAATVDDQSCLFDNDEDNEVPQCVDNQKDWADSVHWSDQADKKDGSAITDPNRTNPDAALGEADWVTNGSTGFFSLGFGGSIKVAFDNYVIDTEGVDISIHEATNGANYPLEKAEVWVSQNGDDWFMIGYADNTAGDRVTYLDFGSTGLNWIQFVKVVDVSDASLHDATADGFDLDAVDATKSVCDRPEEPEPTGQCEIEGHKYDAEGNPLEGWTIGLMKVATDGESTNVYDILSDITDEDGYYCLEWGDNPSFTLRGEDNIEGEYTSFVYHVYEMLKEGWKNLSIEMGADVDDLAVVDAEDIDVDGAYVSTQIGEENGYIVAEAAYHVDFYNQRDGFKGEEITVCKYETDGDSESSVPVEGWPMTISNNGEGEGLVTYELETEEDGCVTQVVNPDLGPWFVYEGEVAGWVQVDADANGGYVDSEEDEVEYCVFDRKYYEETTLNETFSAQAVVVDDEYFSMRCDFYNDDTNVPEDETPDGGGNGRKISLGGDEPDRRVDGDSDSDQDNSPGRVLGEQTSILPAGAPNTGAGGASTYSVLSLLQLVYVGRRK